MSKEQDISGTERRRFRPYPQYKDSGVEWLGKIPTHWGTDRLKYVVTVNNERSYDQESDLPFIGLEHIESGTGKLLTSTEDVNGEIGEIESSSSHFRPGDILFGKLRPYLAKVLKPDFEGRCSTEVIVLRCGGNIDPQNLSYQLLSSGFISWINSMTYGAKMPRANSEQIVNTKVPLSSLPEQQAIAKFLDRETAKIDTLIAKNKRLIELLQEKRTALITQAVTKGLDPNVPMKDSGVEWLGKIPAHWRILPFKRLFEVTYRYPTYYGIEYVLDGVREIRGEAIAPDGRIFELKDQRYISPELSAQFGQTILREGDLVMSVHHRSVVTSA